MDIYIADVRELESEQAFCTGMQLLLPKRRERILSYRNYSDQLRGLGAGLLLEYGLRQQGMTLLEEDKGRMHVSLSEGEYGKPYLAGMTLQFNLSHAGNYVAAVFATEDAGIDIEKIRTANPKLVSRFFSEEEQDFWKKIESADMPDRECDAIFTKIWTRKESYIKAVGEGMHRSLSGFSVVGEDGIWEKTVSCFGYEIRTWEQPADYIVSVCGAEVTEVEPILISLKEKFGF